MLICDAMQGSKHAEVFFLSVSIMWEVDSPFRMDAVKPMGKLKIRRRQHNVVAKAGIKRRIKQ